MSEKKFRETLAKESLSLDMKAKNVLADMLTGMMNDDMKKEMLDKFQEKYKDHPQRDTLVEQMRLKLGLRQK